jgi:hypothetical protein
MSASALIEKLTQLAFITNSFAQLLVVHPSVEEVSSLSLSTLKAPHPFTASKILNSEFSFNTSFP